MNVLLVYQSGGDFHFEDVYLLACKLRKYWKGKAKLNIFCLSDLVTKPIAYMNLFTLLPMTNSGWKGWWAKMNLFSSAYDKLRPFLYLDLDTAVVNDWDDSLIAGYEDQFIALEDFYRGSSLASGIMWFPVNEKNFTPKSITLDLIWKHWTSRDTEIMSRFKGDQEYLQTQIINPTFFQQITNKITTFKPMIDRKVHLLDKIPDGVSFICFHGQPRIRNASIEWVKGYVKNEG